jgi:peptidoglycan-associated lipoprotein
MCKIQEPERAPTFDFDDATISRADGDVLMQVARCLTTGALQGRTIELVGRADPRGETEYNLTLGASRAASVNGYLLALGVGASQLRPTSRGELDASGTDEESWRLDRRVDLRLDAVDWGY